MTSKTNIFAVLLSTGLAVTAGSAMAQMEARTFSEIDTNGDNLLSNDELDEAFGEERSATLMDNDGDADGMLSTSEVSGMYADNPMIGVPLQDDDDPDYRDDDTPIDPTESAGDLESPEELED